MSEALDRLAEAYGISLGYVSETGVDVRVTERAKRGVLAALGIAADTERNIAASLAAAPASAFYPTTGASGVRCFVPAWLEDGRAWGITCQLYGVRSERNWGIGDFEDLARLAEYAGACGADFLGVNPLHALFTADPRRRSPYSPSSRRFLNPLYIAPDLLGVPRADYVAVARNATLVDYTTVARLKLKALAARFGAFERDDLRHRTPEALEFEAFCHQRGPALELFACYEAMSAACVAEGHSSGWHAWPEAYRSPASAAVLGFARKNASQILFHKWLQWIADRQLGNAQRRARAAGMRIGLYLDLAVGVAPDGADTWAHPASVIGGVHVGCPPDPFHPLGQDWGLSPLSPVVVHESGGAAIAEALDELMRYAGAVRIDHVMGLVRLFWIPAGLPPTDGAYVKYPADVVMRELAAVSVQRKALVIGEDLGTVPAGFRDIMRDLGIQGYRVLFFERGKDGKFRRPEKYARDALACISTHDLPTLRGWWRGSDITQREHLGLIDHADAGRLHDERAREHGLLIGALVQEGLISQNRTTTRGATSDQRDLMIPDDILIALHAFLARTSSRLVAIQLEDLLGMEAQANFPGTVDEHPNWQHKLPVPLEALPGCAALGQIVRVMARERSRAL